MSKISKIHGKRLLCLLIALTCILMLAYPVSAAADGTFRAVWVSTVYNLDYPAKPTADSASLRTQADRILDNCAKMGMTAVILQVRPSADALYPSDIFPWSVYLTGEAGKAPSGDFDPLQYWLDGAHERGMELHAWINPYRITKKKDAEFASLPDSHPAKQHPGWVVRYTDSNYYFDPGIPQVRQLVADGVAELLDRYDVDGIHLDDYFYPGTDFDDSVSFQKYGSGSLADWRRENVNLLVRELRDTVRKHEHREVSYGISPAGIWANRSSLPDGSETAGGETYFSHYADTKKWVTEGWVDYICPQIYWNIGHDKADYETLARWWSDVTDGTGVRLYIGMADYRAGEADKASPWHGIAELKRQAALNRTLGVDGEVHFRYGTMMAVDGLTDYYAGLYQ